MHSFGMGISSVQLRVGAPVWWPCASTAVEPALRQVSYARCAQGSTGDCDQPSLFELRLAGHFGPPCRSAADFLCKKVVPGHTGGRLHFWLMSGWLIGVALNWNASVRQIRSWIPKPEGRWGEAERSTLSSSSEMKRQAKCHPAHEPAVKRCSST